MFVSYLKRDAYSFRVKHNHIDIITFLNIINYYCTIVLISAIGNPS